MSIVELITKIIPPSDYQHRDSFSNKRIIDNLTDDEKNQVEEALIKKLSQESITQPDILIIETLAYLKSQKSLVLMYGLLKTAMEYQIDISTYIYLINQDDNMIDTAINAFRKTHDKTKPYYVFGLIHDFYSLSQFKVEKVNKLIEEYTTSDEMLVAYNSKRALRLQNVSHQDYNIITDMLDGKSEMQSGRIEPNSFWTKLKRIFS